MCRPLDAIGSGDSGPENPDRRRSSDDDRMTRRLSRISEHVRVTYDVEVPDIIALHRGLKIPLRIMSSYPV
jgi:hypothetical protein